MKVVADTHIHLYPCYDRNRALAQLQSSLQGIDQSAYHLAFLAERFDCSVFSELASAEQSGAWRVQKISNQDNVLLLESQDTALYLFAGRQIVTRERIEILALTTDTRIPDGLTAPETVESVLREGALPVLAWAPGKWMFTRKQVVKDLLTRFAPDELLLGDTSLRPTIWPEPFLMREARKKGFKIVAGSDPLPFAGEEAMMGRFVTTVSGNFDPNLPVDSVRDLFRRSESGFRREGRRCSLMQTLTRLYKNIQSKK